MQHMARNHTLKGLTKFILILLTFGLIVSCSAEPKDPAEKLWGQWEYYESENGYDAFEYDIEFVSDGTFLIPETPFLMVNTFEFGILDENRLRLTALGQSEIVGYELDGDTLKLIFEDGVNLYRRKGTSSLPSEKNGETVIRKIDGMEMVIIPAGEFQMGCDPEHNGANPCYPAQLPLHTVYLDSFYIDKFEVSNTQYKKCVKAGDCDAPKNVQAFQGTLRYRGNYPWLKDHPVNFVSWEDAQNYCSWAGGRLPTEAEWEKAARGTKARTYPWGDTEPESNQKESLASFNIARDVFLIRESAVGSYPAGASPYGVLDMAGNVQEWVNDWHSSSYYLESPYTNPQGPASGDDKVIRGYWTTSDRSPQKSDARYSSIGFRCVSPAP